jgi:hypothetical protein
MMFLSIFQLFNFFRGEILEERGERREKCTGRLGLLPFGETGEGLSLQLF